MAGSCPIVSFGVPKSGAPEYNLNSGRELFRCGTECVKMYITNVSGESSTITYSCASIDDANINGEVCLRSAQVSARDQGIVNWIAKENVDSSLEVGSVITKADTCLGGDASIYTHTEGNLSVRVTATVSYVNQDKEQIKNTALNKFDDYFRTGLQWILSDVGTNVGPTDWQGGTVTYQGFGGEKIPSSLTGGPAGVGTARESFNWENGRLEKTFGYLTYDDTDNTDIGFVINQVLGL